MVMALAVYGLAMSAVKGMRIQSSDANTPGGETLETVITQTTLESSVTTDKHVLVFLPFCLFLKYVIYCIDRSSDCLTV